MYVGGKNYGHARYQAIRRSRAGDERVDVVEGSGEGRPLAGPKAAVPRIGRHGWTSADRKAQAVFNLRSLVLVLGSRAFPRVDFDPVAYQSLVSMLRSVTKSKRLRNRPPMRFPLHEPALPAGLQWASAIEPPALLREIRRDRPWRIPIDVPRPRPRWAFAVVPAVLPAAALLCLGGTLAGILYSAYAVSQLSNDELEEEGRIASVVILALIGCYVAAAFTCLGITTFGANDGCLDGCIDGQEAARRAGIRRAHAALAGPAPLAVPMQDDLARSVRDLARLHCSRKLPEVRTPAAVALLGWAYALAQISADPSAPDKPARAPQHLGSLVRDRSVVDFAVCAAQRMDLPDLWLRAWRGSERNPDAFSAMVRQPNALGPRMRATHTMAMANAAPAAACAIGLGLTAQGHLPAEPDRVIDAMCRVAVGSQKEPRPWILHRLTSLTAFHGRDLGAAWEDLCHLSFLRAFRGRCTLRTRPGVPTWPELSPVLSHTTFRAMASEPEELAVIALSHSTCAHWCTPALRSMAGDPQHLQIFQQILNAAVHHGVRPAVLDQLADTGSWSAPLRSLRNEFLSTNSLKVGRVLAWAIAFESRASPPEAPRPMPWHDGTGWSPDQVAAVERLFSSNPARIAVLRRTARDLGPDFYGALAEWVYTDLRADEVLESERLALTAFVMQQGDAALRWRARHVAQMIQINAMPPLTDQAAV